MGDITVPEQQVPTVPGAPQAVIPVPNAMPDQQPDQTGQNPGQATPITPVPATDQPGFADRLHQNANVIASKTPVAAAVQPGSWARQLVASTLASLPRAAQGIQNDLADIGNAKIGEGGNRGLFGGVTAVAAAQKQRIQQEQQQLSAQDMQKAQIAKINIDSNYQQQLLHDLQSDRSDKANNEAIALSKLAVDAATTSASAFGLDPADVIKPDISDVEMHQMLKSKGWKPTEHTFWETSAVPSIDPDTMKQRIDTAGNPVLEKRYTLITTPEQITLDEKHAQALNDNLHPAVPFVAGTTMPGSVALGQFQQASNAHALLQKQQDERDQAELKESTTEQDLARIRASKNLGNDFFQIAAKTGLDLNRTMDYVTGKVLSPQPEINAQTGKPTGRLTMQPDPNSVKYAQDHPNAGQDFVLFMGGLKDYTQIRNSQQKEADDAAEKKAEEANKKIEDLKKQNEGAWSIQEDKDGNPVLLNSKNGQTMPAPAGVQARGTKSKADTAFQKETEPAIAALGYATDYLKNGIFTGSGDEALQEKFFELAKPTTGFRMSQPQMDMLQNSRGWMQSADAKKLHAETGVWFSPVQRQQIVATMNQLANSKLQALHSNAGNPPNISAISGQGGQQNVLKGQAVAGVPHAVIIGGKIAGYSSDGGKTMTTTAPTGSPAVGSQVQ